MKNFSGYPPMTAWQSSLLYGVSKPVQIFNGVRGDLPRNWHRPRWTAKSWPIGSRACSTVARLGSRSLRQSIRTEFELKLIGDLLRYTPTADWYGKVIAGR